MVVLATVVTEEGGVDVKAVDCVGVGVEPEYDVGYWVPVESPLAPVNVGTFIGPVWPT
jgi:hypothetical protein